MLNPVILSIPTLVLPLLLPPPPDCQFERFGDPAADDRAVAAFTVAVEEYAALHRRLERAWPLMGVSGDPEQAEAAAEALRVALRDARPQAAQGAFFTPEVADVFRIRISRALRDAAYEVRLPAWPPGGGEDVDRWTPAVNQPIPWGVSGMKWPFVEMLPALPPEAAYRFIGGDLLLVDVHANLILDILERALPATIPPAEPMVLLVEEEIEQCRPEW